MKRLRLFFSPQTTLVCIFSTILAVLLVGFLPGPSVSALTGTVLAHTTATIHASHTLPLHSSPNARHLFKARGIGSNSRSDSANALLYNGGPVMNSSVTYAIFWEPTTLQDGTGTQVSTTYNSLLQNYFGDIGGSGVYNVNTQYYDSTGHIANNSTFGGSWIDTSAYPTSQCTDSATPQNCLTDAQIQTEVASAMTANNWTSGPTHMFFVFTSSGEGSCFDSGSSACAFTQYCAYHSFFSDSNNQPIIYANMPYTGTNLDACGVTTSPNNDFAADSTINVTSHEHMEAVTDPQLNAWYDAQGNENGDKCAWNFGTPSLDNGNANVQWNSHFYLVQQEWSNASSGCTLSYSTQPPPSGIAYTGSNDGSLHAINIANGTQLWQARTGGSVISSPIVVNGTVFVGSRDRYIYAFNATTGSQLWRVRTGNAIYSSPQVVNGTLFVGSTDGYLYALNSSNGSVRWRFRADGTITTTPALANNVVYISTTNGLLYAINAQGKQMWRILMRGATFSTPTVVNNVLYAGSSNSYVYAFNASNGRQVWHVRTGASLWQTPTVVNNVLYIGAGNAFFFALNAQTGSQLWRYRTKGSIGTAATVVNGVVYFGSYDHNLYALNATSGSLIWRYQTGGHILSTPTIAGGAVYFGSDDRNLYALDEVTSLLNWHYLTGGPVESSSTVVLPPS